MIELCFKLLSKLYASVLIYISQFNIYMFKKHPDNRALLFSIIYVCFLIKLAMYVKLDNKTFKRQSRFLHASHIPCLFLTR